MPEIPIEVQENMTAALKRMGEALSDFNKKTAEGTKGVGAFGEAMAAAGKGLLAPVGLAAGLVATVKALDNFAVGQLRLRNLASDLGVSTTKVQEFNQAFARSGKDAGAAMSEVAGFLEKMKRSGAYMGTDEFTRSLRMSNPALANRIEQLSRAGDAQGALAEFQADYIRQGQLGRADVQQYYRDISGMSHSTIMALGTDLRGTVKDWQYSGDAIRQYHNTMVDLETSVNNVWNSISMHALQALKDQLGGAEGMDQAAHRVADWGKGEIDKTMETVRATIEEIKAIRTWLTGGSEGAPNPEPRGSGWARGTKLDYEAMRRGTTRPLEPPQMARGGIVTQPTEVMLGESGPEAVIPLSDDRIHPLGSDNFWWSMMAMAGGLPNLAARPNHPSLRSYFPSRPGAQAQQIAPGQWVRPRGAMENWGNWALDLFGIRSDGGRFSGGELIRVEEESNKSLREIRDTLQRMEDKPLTKMARGGAVRRPTRALVGEEGPEAIVPIPIAYRNPGDIKWGPFAREHGAIGRGTRGGHAVFATEEEGFAALEALVQSRMDRGQTTIGAFQQGPMAYAEDPGWAGGVSKFLGVGQNDPIPSVRAMTLAIARQEGYRSEYFAGLMDRTLTRVAGNVDGTLNAEVEFTDPGANLRRPGGNEEVFKEVQIYGAPQGAFAGVHGTYKKYAYGG